ncbi:hypothetical protein EAO69_27530 [Streptomyces sp. me109]|nr:hypothetical protein EAO69_27530 [Streptomyces sp. me109]
MRSMEFYSDRFVHRGGNNGAITGGLTLHVAFGDRAVEQGVPRAGGSQKSGQRAPGRLEVSRRC